MKNADPWLEELAKVAQREDPTVDPRWDALAKGSLTKEQEEELRASAERSAKEQQAFEAFRPLDDGARARFADRILASLDEAQEGSPIQGEAPAAEEPRAEPPSEAPAADVIPFPGRRRALRTILVATPLAAAAAAAVFLLRPAEKTSPVPSYELVISGGEREARSATDPAVGVLRLGPGSRLTLTLRPATSVEGPIAVRGLLVQGGHIAPSEKDPAKGDRAVREWSPQVAITSDGAARIDGAKEALFPGIPAGEWEILLAVGRPSELPAADTLREAAALPESETPESAFRVRRARVLLHDGGEGPGP